MADGSHGEIETASETITKAYATLKQSREEFEFAELFK